MLDTAAKRIALGAALGLLVLVAWQRGWLSQIAPVPATADTVVVIEESGDRTPEQAAVLFGSTANALRTANKWRLFDDDELPETLKPVVAKITEKPPYILMFSGDRIVAGPLPFPATEAEFAALIQQYGGH